MNCQHEHTEEREVIFKNNTKHIEQRCLDCGRHVKYLPQPIELLPEEIPDHVIVWGKHKGKRLCEIPPDYLGWMVREKVGRDSRIAAKFLDMQRNAERVIGLSHSMAHALTIDR